MTPRFVSSIEKQIIYDDLGQIRSQKTMTSENETQMTYTYDDIGNRLTKTVIDVYQVTINCRNNGTCSPSGTVSVAENGTVVVTIIPDEGFDVYNVYEYPSQWDLNSYWHKCEQTGNTVTFTLDEISENYNISIDFYRPTGLMGDINGDCSVDDEDLIMVGIHAHYRTYFKPCDLSGDGRVYLEDLVIFRNHEGETCE